MDGFGAQADDLLAVLLVEWHQIVSSAKLAGDLQRLRVADMIAPADV